MQQAEQHTDGAAGTDLAGALIALVYLGYVCVVVWIAVGRPPVKLAMIHTTMRACQRTAAAVGRLGIRAEDTYRRTVDGGAA